MRLYSRFRALATALTLAGLACALACGSVRAAGLKAPDPAVDDSLTAKSGQQSVVLSGGCFWGIQLVFEHVKGVTDVKAGYSGGSAKNAVYEIVSTGTTGHAESVKIIYDPTIITYGQLLKVFFSVAHDPTQLNKQYPDEGTQYRSAIWYADEDQQRIASAYIAQMNQAKVFPNKIVTQVVPLQGFYQAEAYHQDFATHYPLNPYIHMFDLPKLDDLRKTLPGLYVEKR